MRIVLVLPIISVCPSGSEAMTALAAIVPPAPPARFSTMIGWPRAAPILSDRSRAMMSGGPPAGEPTTSLTGRSGNACALGKANGCVMVAINDKASCSFDLKKPRIVFPPEMRGAYLSIDHFVFEVPSVFTAYEFLLIALGDRSMHAQASADQADRDYATSPRCRSRLSPARGSTIRA